MEVWQSRSSKALHPSKDNMLSLPTEIFATSGKRSLFEILYAILRNRMIFLFLTLLKKNTEVIFSLAKKRRRRKPKRKTSLRFDCTDLRTEPLPDHGRWLRKPLILAPARPLPKGSENVNNPLSLGGHLLARFSSLSFLYTTEVCHGVLWSLKE